MNVFLKRCFSLNVFLFGVLFAAYAQTLNPVKRDFTIDSVRNLVNLSSEENKVNEENQEQQVEQVKASKLERLYGISEISQFVGQEQAGQEVLPKKSKKNSSLDWKVFLMGMLGGFIALLTPCVFPIIPPTVSFFCKKKNGGKMALLYGAFIFLIYVLLSMPFHFIDSFNSGILNSTFTSVWLNLICFVVFVVFAFSFFGFFEITIPSWLANKVSSVKDISGVVGIFFMALILILVSFSCAGPILGALLDGPLSSNGGTRLLTIVMSGFGLALTLPIVFFAFFPNLLSVIPKPGSWLNSVKITLGFIELAVALKLLSNADLLAHWGLLKYELFLGILSVIATCLGLYFVGLLNFKSELRTRKEWSFQTLLGFFVLGFVIYLSSGLFWNKNMNAFNSLKILRGILPPKSYSFFYPSACSNNFNCFNDLKAGLEYAKQQNMPVLLDFTRYACANCRKMEEHVWTNESISKTINDKFVLVSLHVDDKSDLLIEEQIEVLQHNGSARSLSNLGHKWAYFQTQFFRSNSQPFYAILSSDGRKVLSAPIGYTPDEVQYAKFLNQGLKAFESNQ